MGVLASAVVAIVKIPFEWLFGAAIRFYKMAKKFPTLRRDLTSNINYLEQRIPLISRTRIVWVSENLTRTMEDGKELARMCDEGNLNFFEKAKYAKKIVKWDESRQRILKLVQTDANLVAQNQNQDLVTTWCAVPDLPSNTLKLDAPLAGMKMKLLRDDARSMLVLTAPPGCGKTTLANMFCHDPQVKAKFKDNIFFATVSNKPSHLVVQELCQHARFRVPALENEEIAFIWLPQFLREAGQNPLLLILDDVPSASESLLDKFDEIKIPDYKILVTSRYHFPKFGPPYNLQALTDKDALTLFRRSAFLPNTSCNIPDDLQIQIVNCCKRFPLAITTVGTSLCNQPIQEWRTKLKKLSKGSSILDSENDSEKKLLALLESCLDDLNREMAPVKDCFIDLALFPQDQRIPVASLLDMWAELYEGSNDDDSIVNLYHLTFRNLASLVVTRTKDLDGYYGEHFVVQHDMLKLLSIRASHDEDPTGHRLIVDIHGDELPPWWTEKKTWKARLVSVLTPWWTEKKQKTKKARLVSVITGESSSTEWHNMDLPKGEVLVLNFQAKNYALPKFMKKMCKLKVLIVTNDGFSPAELSDFELLCSLSNLKRLRLEHISIPLIRENIIPSKSLKKISLFMCNVSQAFGNSSIQIFETFPYLEELHIDYCNDLVKLPAKLCDLIGLKVLSITNSHKLSVLPKDIGKLENLEVLRLRSCTGLEKLPGSIEKLNNLYFLDISNCSSIKTLPEGIDKMNGLRKINMAQCSRLDELPESVYDLGQQLEKVICDEEARYLWESVLSNPNKIRVAKEEFNLNWLHRLQI
ncbi:probable disease resistance protein At5g66900 isoform X1 [Malus sylvestris]|uniref:probable disease resistance protein At5g66900 isoform X1 n=1 Tax=Malus sylvestris TaxID=3752 RepID=UPI0021ACEE35|nr:probable disease resistance protein At5g66900 isoform X1 [Malus sylvestris]